MRIALLNYTGDRMNYGCQATSRELENWICGIAAALGRDISWVKVPMLERNDAYEFVQTHRDAELRRILSQPELSAADGALLMDCCERLYGSVLENIKACDVILFQAEGTMGGTVLHKGVGLLLLPYVCSRLLDKPIIALNGTLFSAVEGFDDMIGNVFSSFDFRSVREASSYHYARSIGLDEVIVLPDAAFHTRPDLDHAAGALEPIPQGDYFCVSGSASLGYTDFDELARTIAEIARFTQLCPAFILSTRRDEQLYEATQILLPGASARVSREATYQQVSGVLAGAEFLITGRYHIAILSACAETPFLCYPSNTFKMEGLIEMLEWPFPVRRYEECSRFVADAQELLANMRGYRTQLQRGLQKVLADCDIGKSLLLSWLNACLATADRKAAHQALSENTQWEKSISIDPQPVSRDVVDYYTSLHLQLDAKRGFKVER